jgi:cardiolipin synthase
MSRLGDMIRAKIDLGVLPLERPERLFAGCGEGEPCAACGAPILRDQLEAMERAVARGVRVDVIMAGEADSNLDRIVRKASHGMFGRALEAGIRIHEYRGALLHAKTLTVDGRWSSVGSANLDRRSFALNHELNLAFDDPGLAHQLEQIFADDLTRCHEVTLPEWRRRGLGRFLELIVLPLRDQL